MTPNYEVPIDILREPLQNVMFQPEVRPMPLQVQGDDLEDALFKLGRYITQRKEAGQNALKTMIEAGKDAATVNLLKPDLSTDDRRYWRGQFEAYNTMLTAFNNAVKNATL